MTYRTSRRRTAAIMSLGGAATAGFLGALYGPLDGGAAAIAAALGWVALVALVALVIDTERRAHPTHPTKCQAFRAEPGSAVRFCELGWRHEGDHEAAGLAWKRSGERTSA